MKFLLILTACMTLSFTHLCAQTTIKYPHCNCEDVITEIEPNLNGNFLRKCNGKIIIQGKFNNDQKDGSWITKSKNGNVIRKFTYKNGVIDGKIEAYYSSGAKKLIGEFANGRKNGNWSYYNEKGKIIKIGSFENGVPVGIWKFFSLNGKIELVVYDFDKKEYTVNNYKESLFEPAAIIQNDNSSEWWIRHIHNTTNNEFKSKPFEGYKLLSDLNVILMEIPLEIWETYVSYNLQANLKFDGNALIGVSIQFIDMYLNDIPEIGLFATTNNADKLSNIDHHNLTKKLLAYNLEEAVWMMGPWINNESELKIYLPYIINKFKNSPFR